MSAAIRRARRIAARHLVDDRVDRRAVTRDFRPGIHDGTVADALEIVLKSGLREDPVLAAEHDVRIVRGRRGHRRELLKPDVTALLVEPLRKRNDVAGVVVCHGVGGLDLIGVANHDFRQELARLPVVDPTVPIRITALDIRLLYINKKRPRLIASGILRCVLLVWREVESNILVVCVFIDCTNAIFKRMTMLEYRERVILAAMVHDQRLAVLVHYLADVRGLAVDLIEELC